MNSLLKLFYILTWLVLVPLHLVLILMGLVIVPFSLAMMKWPPVFWLWYNDEEGCPAWWIHTSVNSNFIAKTFPRFWWFAIRNPINNFRYIFKDRKATKMESNWSLIEPMEAPQLIKKDQKTAYRWLANGIFAGYRRVWLHSTTKYSEFWIGWKINSKVPGMGFTLQLRLYRDVGT